MSNITQNDPSVRLKERVGGMFRGLGAIFLVGVIVQTFEFAPEDLKANPLVLGWVIFGIHVLFGLGLILGSSIILGLSLKSQNKLWKKFGSYGFTSVLVAFLGGIIMVSLEGFPSQIGMLLMTLGFLSASVVYGRFYYLLK